MTMKTVLFSIFFTLMICASFIGCASLGDGPSMDERPARPTTYPQLISPRVTEEWNLNVGNQAERLKIETARVRASRLTVGVIALVAADGTVQGVRIIRSSGLRTMDELAMITFKRVSPLPRPPSRAVRGGYAQVPWEFNLEK